MTPLTDGDAAPDDQSTHSSAYVGTAASAERRHILFVDDDESMRRAITRVLGNRFDLTVCADPHSALAAISQPSSSFAAVFSDLNMPAMSGIDFLANVRKIAPNTVRVLVSGDADLRDAVAAVNQGAVYRLLLKPITTTTLTDAATSACEQHRLLTAEQELLESTVHGCVEALADVLAMVQPEAFGRAKRIQRHVADLGAAIDAPNRWEAEVAAMLSQVGCITLRPETVQRFYAGRPLSADEEAQVARLPKIAEDLIGHIPRLEAVRDILRMQYAPAADKNIPVGARLLRIAHDFDLLIAEGHGAPSALDVMAGREGRYDPELLRRFREIRGPGGRTSTIRKLPLESIDVGMVFAEDVRGPNGLLLVARGQEVGPNLLERIRSRWGDFAGDTQVLMVLGAAPGGSGGAGPASAAA